MFAVIYIVFHLTIVGAAAAALEGAAGRAPAAAGAGDVILNTELAIRTVTNNLFTILKFKGVKEETKLKKFTLMQRFLIAQTLKDHYVLKTITEISKVDKNGFDNVTTSFIGLINEILDVDSKAESNEDNEHSALAAYVTQHLVNYLDNHFSTLVHLQSSYSTYGPVAINLNDFILDILEHKYPPFTPSIGAQNASQDNVTAFDYNMFDNEVPTNETLTGNVTESELLPDINTFWVPDKSKEEVSGRRIFGGTNTKVKHFPFMASVHLFGQFQCGGSILSEDIIITAASCLQIVHNNRFFRENPAFLAVRIGSNFFNDGGENVQVLEVYFHPEYSPKTLNHNLALMRLRRPITFRAKNSHKRVKKIDIDQRATPLPTTTPGITVLGWGATSRANVIKKPWLNRIKFAVLDYYPFADCQDIYNKKYVTEKNFCAGFMSKGGGACNHDIGGPGVTSGILVGVISFGSPVCGTPDAPTVFTKVGYYHDWIETILEQSVKVPRKKNHVAKTIPAFVVKPEAFVIKEAVPAHYGATDFEVEPLDEYESSHTTSEPLMTRAFVFSKYDAMESQYRLFRQFLKGMFDSQEVDAFLVQFRSKLNKLTLREEIPRNNAYPIKSALRMREPVNEILEKVNTPLKNKLVKKEKVKMAREHVNENHLEGPLINDQILQNVILNMQQGLHTTPMNPYQSQWTTPSQQQTLESTTNSESTTTEYTMPLIDTGKKFIDENEKEILPPRNEKGILRWLQKKKHAQKKTHKRRITTTRQHKKYQSKRKPMLRQFLGNRVKAKPAFKATKSHKKYSRGYRNIYNKYANIVGSKHKKAKRVKITSASMRMTTAPDIYDMLTEINDKDIINFMEEVGTPEGFQDYGDVVTVDPNDNKDYALGYTDSPYLQNGEYKQHTRPTFTEDKEYFEEDLLSIYENEVNELNGDKPEIEDPTAYLAEPPSINEIILQRGVRLKSFNDYNVDSDDNFNLDINDNERLYGDISEFLQRYDDEY